MSESFWIIVFNQTVLERQSTQIIVPLAKYTQSYIEHQVIFGMSVGTPFFNFIGKQLNPISDLKTGMSILMTRSAISKFTNQQRKLSVYGMIIVCLPLPPPNIPIKFLCDLQFFFLLKEFSKKQQITLENSRVICSFSSYLKSFQKNYKSHRFHL